MMFSRRNIVKTCAATALFSGVLKSRFAAAASPSTAYLASDLRIPFWTIVWGGIWAQARSLGWSAAAYSADNDAKTELENMVKCLRGGVNGVIISPTNSTAGATLLRLAAEAGVPAVVADIGADSEDYVSYIASDNRSGAYALGKLLTAEMKRRNMTKSRVGIIAIPQKRANGQARTAGFMAALDEAGVKAGGMRQQADFSYQETYRFALELLHSDERVQVLWLQGSDRYQAALDAIAASGRKSPVLLLTFDAEPEYMTLIPKGVIFASGMQQPFLIGEKAVQALRDHLQGIAAPKRQLLPILPVSAQNIAAQTTLIRRNVLGLTDE